MSPIVHGEICSVSLAINADVMSLNNISQYTVLLDKLGNPLLADFGLAKIQGLAEYPIPEHCHDNSNEGLRWKAPELILCHTSGWTSIGDNYTTMSDVYAFALLCLEVCKI